MLDLSSPTDVGLKGRHFLCQYKRMSQIDITVLKQGTQSKKVLSCSFFQMNDPYRDFSKYERSFKVFLQKIPDGFELRIYVDDTTKEFVLKHATQSSATILHFDCPEFREGKGHTGTFGTFARFLPLFEKGHDVVWVTDVDVPESYLDPELEQQTPDAMIHTYVCYERKVYGTPYTILAGSFISRIQFPKASFTRFLTKLKSGKLNSVVDALNRANTRKPAEKMCPYGMDEYFMNTVIYKFVQEHADRVLIWKNYSAENYLRGVTSTEKDILNSYYRSPTSTLFKKVREIYRKYLPGLLETYPCLKPMYDKLDSFKDQFEEWKVIAGSDL